MTGNEDIGEYDLMISNVQLEDDAEDQCQVSPGTGTQSLQHSANLVVLSKDTWTILKYMIKISACTKNSTCTEKK